MATTANKVVQLTAARIGRMVDEAGALKAQIAALQQVLDGTIEALKEHGDAEYIGKFYKVVVNTTERVTLDNKVVKSMLTVAQIEQATKVSLVQTAAVKAR